MPKFIYKSSEQILLHSLVFEFKTFIAKKLLMIEEKIRKFENWHILLWLIKDLCWVMDFKRVGTFMIFPTVILALVITFKTRNVFSELMHNIAVVCWICANSVWMFGEFYYNDTTRPIAQVFFFAGLGVLFIYYGYFFIRKFKV